MKINRSKERKLSLTKKKKKMTRSRLCPAKAITDADYADDLALLANTPVQAKFLLHCLELATRGIGLYVNQFIYLDNNISSTESDVNICVDKVWTASNRLSTIWKSDLIK